MTEQDMFFLYNCVCSQVFDSPDISIVSVIPFKEVDQTYKSQLYSSDEYITAAMVLSV